MKSIEDHERELTKFALEELNRVENIKLHGSAKNRGGVISFTLKDIHSLDLAQFLNEDNIAIRVGHHCAQPLLNKLGETSTARISFYLYNDDSDIDSNTESNELNIIRIEFEDSLGNSKEIIVKYI